ncbi:MAG: hypothetical protein JWL98_1152 [Xanthomonadaceae bacterium]|nr:hypothetical protein [Xanthomonadaceae bacterium]
MNEANGYAVFFFPQALEALGEAVQPYLQQGPAGPHVLCGAIDTSGSLIEMTLRGDAGDGKLVVLELMVPVSMVRMIVSTQSDEVFGFRPRLPVDIIPVLPAVGPTAEPATAATASIPEGGAGAQAGKASTADASTGDAGGKPAA